MNLDELKKSMSTLDDVLAEKSGENINFNSAACNSAQKKSCGHTDKARYPP